MAAADAGCGIWGYLGIGALLVSALVTAAYLILPAMRAWTPRNEAKPAFTERDRDPGWRMLTVFAVLCIAMLVLGCVSGPVMNALANLTGGTGGAV